MFKRDVANRHRKGFMDDLHYTISLIIAYVVFLSLPGPVLIWVVKLLPNKQFAPVVDVVLGIDRRV